MSPSGTHRITANLAGKQMHPARTMYAKGFNITAQSQGSIEEA